MNAYASSTEEQKHMTTKISLACLTLVFFASTAHSSLPAKDQKMKMSRAVTVRQADGLKGELQVAGSLPPGAVVRIPVSILEKNVGADNATETALMDWLGNTGELRDFTTPNGETKKDFFFPVEVVDPKGSGLAQGAMVYVPIRFLARSKGVNMILEADPELSEADASMYPAGMPEADDPQPVVTKNDEPSNQSSGFLSWLNFSSFASSPTAVPAESKTEEPAPMKPVAKKKPQIVFLPAIRKQLKNVDKKTLKSIVNRRDTLNMASLYNKTCPGKFDDFRKEVDRVALEQKVPSEVLMSIMHMETAGRCVGIKRPAKHTRDTGLFQINTNSTRVARCTPWQIKKLAGSKTMKQLRDGSLKCLENPIVNLEEAASVLRSKYAIVNTQKQPDYGRWDKGTASSHDDWRKAISAYNGGQQYMIQTYNDIVAYNRKNGTSLDPDSWENRRVFSFRRVLDRKIDKVSFDNTQKYRRKLKYILVNITYVETIAGRETKPVENQLALVMQWVRTLYDVPVRLISSNR
jgi:hypothetical protein